MPGKSHRQKAALMADYGKTLEAAWDGWCCQLESVERVHRRIEKSLEGHTDDPRIIRLAIRNLVVTKGMLEMVQEQLDELRQVVMQFYQDTRIRQLIVEDRLAQQEQRQQWWDTGAVFLWRDDDEQGE